MTYVSRPVAHVREDPVPGEKIRLLVGLGEAGDPERVAEAVEALGGEVVADRGFGTLEVELAQEAVGDVCDLPGLAAVETTGTLTIDPDGAGEDVRY